MVAERLQRAGYIDRGHSGGKGGHLLIRESVPDIRTVHAHVVELADSQWDEYLRFRDLLRADAATRRAYEALKRRLAQAFANDRVAYTAGKDAFIRGALERLPASRHDASERTFIPQPERDR